MSLSNASSGSTSSVAERDADIRPFRVEVSQADLDDLRRRIQATRWPDKETVADQSQGVQPATIQALARYWATDYDLRRFEARLNAVPQFVTEIDGLDIHFIHVRSTHDEPPAGHHHPRLARLGHRDAQRHRPAHRPDRTWRQGRRRVRCGDPVDARLRISRASRRPLAGTRSTSRTRGSS